MSAENWMVITWLVSASDFQACGRDGPTITRSDVPKASSESPTTRLPVQSITRLISYSG